MRIEPERMQLTESPMKILLFTFTLPVMIAPVYSILKSFQVLSNGKGRRRVFLKPQIPLDLFDLFFTFKGSETPRVSGSRLQR